MLSAAWSDFFTPFLVLDKNAVVPLKVYRLQTDTSIQMNTYFMALVFASIPPFIIFAFFQKRILDGINVGGVKENNLQNSQISLIYYICDMPWAYSVRLRFIDKRGENKENEI